MVEVVQIIQKSPYASELIDRFCERFKYMGYLDHARMMVNKMLGEDSPFGSAEVINTEMGSHLFRSLVEVDPESVADSLWRTLSVLDTDQLRKMENGRRNLVWTVEKLCFDPRTFDKGAQLMLRMAIAENEHISNNATGEFVRLFPIYLPATAVDLDTRLDFLRSHFAVESEREVVSFGVESALVDTETKSIKFEYRTSGAPANLVERSYSLKSDDGMIVAEVAYYDNFSQQGL